MSAGLSGIYSLGTIVEFERGRVFAALICALAAAAHGMTLAALLFNAPDFASVRIRLWNTLCALRVPS